MENILETERLILRKADHRDAPFILELVNTPKWHAYIGDRGVRTLAHAQTYIDERMNLEMEQGFGFGVFALKEQPEQAIGTCGLGKREGLPHADLGFATLPTYEGKGYTKEVSIAVLGLAKDYYQLDRVIGIVLPTNENSIGLLSSLGFVHTGEQVYEGETLHIYTSML